MNKAKRIQLAHIVGLSALHICAFIYFDVDSISLGTMFLFFITYQLKTLGITVGYHRLFTHKSFEAKRGVTFLLALMGTFAGQGPLKRWVFHHRDHHKFSDLEGDPHSPVAKGFIHSHFGWLLREDTFNDEKFKDYNLKLYPEVEILSTYFTSVFLLQIPILYFLGEFLTGHGGSYVYWGFLVSTLLTLHSTFAVNSLCHMFGGRDYETKDNSRNNLLVALLTNGEGWHNNHHAKPRVALHGHKKLQIDVSYNFIKMLEKLGMASNIVRLKK